MRLQQFTSSFISKHFTSTRIATIATLLSLSFTSLSSFGDNLNTRAATNTDNDSIEYPAMLRKKGVQGVVKLSYDINTQGKAVNIQQVGKANHQLFLSAKAALAKEKFDVALDDGQPQTITDKQRVYRFNLTNLDERGRLINRSTISKQVASR